MFTTRGYWYWYLSLHCSVTTPWPSRLLGSLIQKFVEVVHIFAVIKKNLQALNKLLLQSISFYLAAARLLRYRRDDCCHFLKSPLSRSVRGRRRSRRRGRRRQCSFNPSKTPKIITRSIFVRFRHMMHQNGLKFDAELESAISLYNFHFHNISISHSWSARPRKGGTQTWRYPPPPQHGSHRSSPSGAPHQGPRPRGDGVGESILESRKGKGSGRWVWVGAFIGRNDGGLDFK